MVTNGDGDIYDLNFEMSHHLSERERERERSERERNNIRLNMMLHCNFPPHICLTHFIFISYFALFLLSCLFLPLSLSNSPLILPLNKATWTVFIEDYLSPLYSIFHWILSSNMNSVQCPLKTPLHYVLFNACVISSTRALDSESSTGTWYWYS